MEMTESIYRKFDPDEDSISLSTVKYEDLNKTSNHRHSGPWKSGAVCLGLLCTLLLCGIAVLSVQMIMMRTKQSEQSYREKLHMQADYDNMTSDYQQLQMSYNDLNSVKAQLQDTNNNLTRDISQLQTRFNNLLSEKSSLQAQYDSVNRGKSQLQDRYDRLTRDKSQLQERCDAITAERDTLLQRTVTAKKQITQYAVDVTLDPDTANNYLILSADGKQVKHGDTSQNRPDNPKRFDRYLDVLGKQGFSSGRFYYEVQVSGKTKWSLGVAIESVNRKGETSLSPTNGFWAIWLRDSQYKALAGPDVTLSLKEKPERVGVFVDYGAGLVSFYDADRWSLIYSYEGESFREKNLYPYFTPKNNDNGKNSAPLVITPVSCLK
ncbi:nuclear factor 7, brain-like [Engraulis encrasicolus]|uniref:nuclear factor 7, brain-like n=1 Tax=Engraulis encrasicolus TaxID=184585 RepID=UPI002FD08581